jgi:SAM-dependent methyltransferase
MLRMEVRLPGDMDSHYGSRNPVVRYIFNARLREIERLLPAGGDGSLLDAGCGQGHFLGRVRNRGFRLYGIDASAEAIAVARQRLAGATVDVGDLTQLGFADEAFDVVVCTEVIEHVSQYRAALSEMKRVLKPNGRLILTFPNEPLCMVMRALFLRPPRVPDHINSFSPRQMAREVGLPVEATVALPFHVPAPIGLIHILVFGKNQRSANPAVAS